MLWSLLYCDLIVSICRWHQIIYDSFHDMMLLALLFRIQLEQRHGMRFHIWEKGMTFSFSLCAYDLVGLLTWNCPEFATEIGHYANQTVQMLDRRHWKWILHDCWFHLLVWSRFVLVTMFDLDRCLGHRPNHPFRSPPPMIDLNVSIHRLAMKPMFRQSFRQLQLVLVIYQCRHCLVPNSTLLLLCQIPDGRKIDPMNFYNKCFFMVCSLLELELIDLYQRFEQMLKMFQYRYMFLELVFELYHHLWCLVQRPLFLHFWLMLRLVSLHRHRHRQLNYYFPVHLYRLIRHLLMYCRPMKCQHHLKNNE